MPIIDLDLVEYDSMLKENYSTEVIDEISTSVKTPAHGTIKTKSKGGKTYVQPIEFDGPAGGSADFVVARDEAAATEFEDFKIPRQKSYQFAYMDNETLDASEGNLNAFKPAMLEVGRVFRQMGLRDARHLFGTTSGSIGQIQTGTVLTGAVITLRQWSDAIKFKRNMILEFSGTDGGGALRTGQLIVTKISLRDGEITVNANLNTVTAITDADFIFPKGDHDKAMAGFASWIPKDRTILSTLFFGVDRSLYEERLAGWYLDATGVPYDEALIELVSLASLNSGMPDVGFMHPMTLSQLMVSWQSKRNVDKTETKGRSRIGFKGFTVTAGAHEITLFGDIFCPLDDMYVLTWNTWIKFHAGKGSPQFLLRRGKGMTIEPDPFADRWRSRIGGYRNVACRNPGANARATITPPSI